MNASLSQANKIQTKGVRTKYITDERSPPVRTVDLNNGLVKAEIHIPGLEPGRDKYHPKGGTVLLDFLNRGYGFELKATMKDAANKKKTIYKFKVRQLPGRIDMTESKWDVEKGKIVVMMEKHPDEININWNHLLYTRGLDQATSSESDDS